MLILMTTIVPDDIYSTIYCIFMGNIFSTCANATIIAFFVSYVNHANDSEENIDHRRTVSQSFLNYLNKDSKVSSTTNTNNDDSFDRSVTISGFDDGRMNSKSSSLIPQIAAMEYFDYIENERGGINERKFISSSLPDHFRNKFYVQLMYGSLSSLDIFHHMHPNMIKDMLMNIDHIVMRKNEVKSSLDLNGLCYIYSGSVNISSKRDRRILQVHNNNTILY